MLSLATGNARKSPNDALQEREIDAIVLRVTSRPLGWLTHSAALLLRSQTELNGSRALDRALLQMQALVEQHRAGQAAAWARS